MSGLYGTSLTATCTLLGESMTKTVERGCPQGGVLSPILWNLVIDELLVIIGEEYPQSCLNSFADDLALYNTGIDLQTVSYDTQRAIKRIEKWCEGVDLCVDQKAEVMLVTRQKKVYKRQLMLNGKRLEYKDAIKYLGVVIDHNLTWTPHCQQRASKSAIALAQCRRAVGQKWGLRPKVMHWIYTAVIRPGIVYGSLVWVNVVNKQTALSRLERAQRTALLCIFGVMKSTPTAAMEVLMNVRPISVYVQEIAISTMWRLKCRKQWLPWALYGRTLMRTHIQHCEAIGDKIPLIEFPCDFEKSHLEGERLFNVIIKSRRLWADEGYPEIEPQAVTCHTDGSKLEGRTGAAFTLSSLTYNHEAVI